MSRSRKDGRRGGGHRNTQDREYSNRRKRGATTVGRFSKRVTHRHERRAARAEARDS